MENFVLGVDAGKVATHTSFIDCNYTSLPADRPARPCSWLFLTGATEEKNSYLVDLPKSWHNPADIQTGYESGNIPGMSYGPLPYEGYAFSERAYRFRKMQGNKVSFTIKPKLAVIDPAIRVIGWNSSLASLFLDGEKVSPQKFCS